MSSKTLLYTYKKKQNALLQVQMRANLLRHFPQQTQIPHSWLSTMSTASTDYQAHLENQLFVYVGEGVTQRRIQEKGKGPGKVSSAKRE